MTDALIKGMTARGWTLAEALAEWDMTSQQWRALLQEHPAMAHHAAGGLPYRRTGLDSSAQLPELIHKHFDLSAPRLYPFTTSHILLTVGLPDDKRSTIRAGTIIARLLGVPGPRRTCGRHVYDMPAPRPIDPFGAMFAALYDPSAPRTRTMTVTEVLDELSIAAGRQTERYYSTRIAAALGVTETGRRKFQMPEMRG